MAESDYIVSLYVETPDHVRLFDAAKSVTLMHVSNEADDDTEVSYANIFLTLPFPTNVTVETLHNRVVLCDPRAHPEAVKTLGRSCHEGLPNAEIVTMSRSILFTGIFHEKTLQPHLHGFHSVAAFPSSQPSSAQTKPPPPNLIALPPGIQPSFPVKPMQYSTYFTVYAFSEVNVSSLAQLLRSHPPMPARTTTSSSADADGLWLVVQPPKSSTHIIIGETLQIDKTHSSFFSASSSSLPEFSSEIAGRSRPLLPHSLPKPSTGSGNGGSGSNSRQYTLSPSSFLLISLALTRYIAVAPISRLPTPSVQSSSSAITPVPHITTSKGQLRVVLPFTPILRRVPVSLESKMTQMTQSLIMDVEEEGLEGIHHDVYDMDISASANIGTTAATATAAAAPTAAPAIGATGSDVGAAVSVGVGDLGCNMYNINGVGMGTAVGMKIDCAYDVDRSEDNGGNGMDYSADGNGNREGEVDWEGGDGLDGGESTSTSKNAAVTINNHGINMAMSNDRNYKPGENSRTIINRVYTTGAKDDDELCWEDSSPTSLLADFSDPTHTNIHTSMHHSTHTPAPIDSAQDTGASTRAHIQKETHTHAQRSMITGVTAPTQVNQNATAHIHTSTSNAAANMALASTSTSASIFTVAACADTGGVRGESGARGSRSARGGGGGSGNSISGEGKRKRSLMRDDDDGDDADGDDADINDNHGVIGRGSGNRWGRRSKDNYEHMDLERPEERKHDNLRDELKDETLDSTNNDILSEDRFFHFRKTMVMMEKSLVTRISHATEMLLHVLSPLLRQAMILDSYIRKKHVPIPEIATLSTQLFHILSPKLIPLSSSSSSSSSSSFSSNYTSPANHVSATPTRASHTPKYAYTIPISADLPLLVMFMCLRSLVLLHQSLSITMSTIPNALTRINGSNTIHSSNTGMATNKDMSMGMHGKNGNDSERARASAMVQGCLSECMTVHASILDILSYTEEIFPSIEQWEAVLSVKGKSGDMETHFSSDDMGCINEKTRKNLVDLCNGRDNINLSDNDYDLHTFDYLNDPSIDIFDIHSTKNSEETVSSFASISLSSSFPLCDVISNVNTGGHSGADGREANGDVSGDRSCGDNWNTGRSNATTIVKLPSLITNSLEILLRSTRDLTKYINTIIKKTTLIRKDVKEGMEICGKLIRTVFRCISDLQCHAVQQITTTFTPMSIDNDPGLGTNTAVIPSASDRPSSVFLSNSTTTSSAISSCSRVISNAPCTLPFAFTPIILSGLVANAVLSGFAMYFPNEYPEGIRKSTWVSDVIRDCTSTHNLSHAASGSGAGADTNYLSASITTSPAVHSDGGGALGSASVTFMQCHTYDGKSIEINPSVMALALHQCPIRGVTATGNHSPPANGYREKMQGNGNLPGNFPDPPNIPTQSTYMASVLQLLPLQSPL